MNPDDTIVVLTFTRAQLVQAERALKHAQACCPFTPEAAEIAKFQARLAEALGLFEPVGRAATQD